MLILTDHVSVDNELIILQFMKMLLLFSVANSSVEKDKDETIDSMQNIMVQS